MTALTLTALDTLGAVRLQVTGAPAGPLTITRRDRNGTGTVRLLAGQEPIGGSLTVVDHESALTGVVAYDAVDSAAVTTTKTVTTAAAGLVVLTVVGQPNRRAVLQAVTGYDETRESSSPVLEVIDRDDPIVVTRALSTRRGTIDVYAATYPDAAAASAVLKAGLPVMLRQDANAGMDLYAVVRRVTARADTTQSPASWRLTLDYVEQRPPAGPLLGAAGWSWADVAANYPTWNDARAAFATWNDLVAGP